ncbi:hypothetical protein E1B28_006227 [Marasmius oreades]|uniref:Transmembrane protein n=1 Tax=Marasmius oreades TaxID=181124 RepID=A0A9P7S7M1_9AGAR|nr:uncharacterized protein E1B28_006227 [Marasmius oreades]KAG7095488.1 hypothetical protein E1B28_006227 [Marasmius oreades]
MSNVLSGVNETEITAAPPLMVFQDTQKDAITYSPKGSWNSQPENVLEFTQGTGHSTSQLGASINFTFIVSMHLSQLFVPPFTNLPIGPSYSGHVHVFTARRAIQRQKQMLFHSDGLAPGSHTVTMTNGNGGDLFTRQADDVDLLEFDYATVWNAEVLSSQASPSSSQPPATMTVEAKHGASGLSSGAIVGITSACVLFVALLGVLWGLNRRNRTLWMRLNKGYMVQTQFDCQSTTSIPSGNPEMASLDRRTMAPPTQPNLDRNNSSHHILPICSSSEALRSQESASTTVEHTYPLTGYSRDRSSSKGSTEVSDSIINTSQGNPYPDDAYPVRNPGDHDTGEDRTGPARSGTLDTISTLVAEDGSQVDSEDARSSLKIFTRSPLMGPRPWKERNPPPTPAPTLASSNSGSQSTRRHTPKGFRLRTPRSSSPSATRRLLPNQDQDDDQIASGSDGEFDEDDEADFYASEAPFSATRIGSPSISIANTQFDTPTSIRGRYSSLLSTNLGIPSRVDEESERELVEAAQLQALYIQRTHQDHSDIGNLVDDPMWEYPTVDSPPPVYTSTRASLADRHRQEETLPRL